MSISQNEVLKKIHIIFILSFSPRYEHIDGPEPIHRWKNDKGEEIGVWKEDWAYLLGFKIMEKYPDIIFEVLRPDHRAERIYEHTFENGLIHKSFPEDKIKIWRRNK